jgi:hypothetical protein
MCCYYFIIGDYVNPPLFKLKIKITELEYTYLGSHKIEKKIIVFILLPSDNMVLSSQMSLPILHGKVIMSLKVI